MYSVGLGFVLGLLFFGGLRLTVWRLFQNRSRVLVWRSYVVRLMLLLVSLFLLRDQSLPQIVFGLLLARQSLVWRWRPWS